MGYGVSVVGGRSAAEGTMKTGGAVVVEIDAVAAQSAFAGRRHERIDRNTPGHPFHIPGSYYSSPKIGHLQREKSDMQPRERWLQCA